MDTSNTENPYGCTRKQCRIIPRCDAMLLLSYNLSVQLGGEHSKPMPVVPVVTKTETQHGHISTRNQHANQHANENANQHDRHASEQNWYMTGPIGITTNITTRL